MYSDAFFLFLTFSLFSAALDAQAIKINEVVAVNTQYYDEDGDTPDWLELRNFGSSSVSLEGWQLTDDLSAEAYWTFPGLVIDPDEHLVIWASGKDRSSLNIGRTFISQGDAFRYLVPTQSVAEQWRAIDFDDSSWSLGDSGFGYADGDDTTEVPYGTRSVFVRKQFNIADISLIESLLFDIDYDDGFVAYINGIEIARENISGIYPAFNVFAFGNREATIYANGLPTRYLIEAPQSILQNGENVLSIQVHNATAQSSDMSLIPFLSALYIGPTNEGSPPDVLIPIPTSSLHTDFKISSTGETIYLLDANGIFIDSLETTNLIADVSLGIPYDNESDLAYYTTPSPGEPNGGENFAGINTESVVFSHDGGITNVFNLSLSGVSAPAVIRFTVDASVPTENDPIYTNPIPVTGSMVVRARIFRDNYLPSTTDSRTYLLGATHDLPIISLVSEPDNLFDNEIGIYALGNDYESEFPYFGANFWEDWECSIHVSLYENTGALGVEFNGGAKIFGGWSRGNEQRSFSIFARQQYGVDEIAYPLFSSRSYDSYQSFVLRNAGNDFLNTNMRDLTLTSLMDGAGLEVQANRPAVTYINGDYWGFYNIREKVNEHFLAAKFDLDPDQINIVEKNSELIHGSNQSYLNLYDFIANNSLFSEANYNQVAEQIDIENFIIYNVAQIYVNNTDWPGNNIKFWQPIDGKWRWILFDIDFGFGTWNNFDYFNNTLNFALEANGPGWPNPPWSTLLFRKLIENIGFRNEFINRYADELNSRFLPARVSAHIDSLAARVASEIVRHYSRWGGDINSWAQQVNNMKNFGNLRPFHAKGHIRSTFNLPAFHSLTITIADTEQGYVRINNRLTVDENTWTGDYFQSVPFAVEAYARPGYVFSHWESSQGTFSDVAISVNIIGAMSLRPVFVLNPSAESPIVINEINYSSSADFDTGDWIELYNPNNFSVDISNWVLRDDDDSHGFILPAGTVMQADSYWILTRDRDRFQDFHPSIEQLVGNFDFGLSVDGDAVRLYNADLVLQDEVHYLPNAPWPVAAGGQGPTLELISPELDNSLAESWVSYDNDFGSPGASNLLTGTTTTHSLVQFQYFPNPFNDQINMQLQLSGSALLTAQLFDARGVAVHTLVDQHLGAGQYTFTASLNHLPKGMYFLEVRSNNTRLTSKRWVKM